MNETKYSTDLEILEKEVEIGFFRSSGAGGQNVNKRETAVRLRHIPSGIVIEAQEERTQGQNRRIAFERLIVKLEELNRTQTPRVATKVPRREKRRRLAEKRERSKKIERRRVEKIDNV